MLRNSLSLDASYLLVQRRSHCSPDDVIDDAWFEDWEDIDLWVLVSQGFFSFSSFALYRSKLSYSEDWRRRPDLQVDFCFIDENHRRSESITEFSKRLQGLPSWFAALDWYDPTEWNDNLGWVHHVVEGEHPYLRDQSLEIEIGIQEELDCQA